MNINLHIPLEEIGKKCLRKERSVFLMSPGHEYPGLSKILDRGPGALWGSIASEEDSLARVQSKD